MTCPPDYICNATPAWVVLALLAFLVLILFGVALVAWWADRR